MNFRLICAAAFAAGASLFSSSALAWGPYGHAIVADIAQQRLTPQASRVATELLATEGHHTLDQVASWPDTMGHISKKKGGHPETLVWHYVDIDVANDAYDKERDCPEGLCVVEKLPEQIHILGDVHASTQQRLDALKWVVHLIGDIHQPLHAAERHHDKGGNDIRLTYFGDNANGHMNLHALWDGGVIDREANLHVGPHYSIEPKDAQREADRLSALITADETAYWVQDLDHGDVHAATVAWADESHGLARTVVYGALPQNKGADIREAYTNLAWPIIELRLEQAGVRLAAVLNAALQGG